MIEGRPSNTAFQVAAARAAHLKFDPPPHLLEDVHAEALLDDEGRLMIDGYKDGGPWILLENRLFLPLRGRVIEDRLAEAYARGVRQFVILGAGLDSFAWRQPTSLPDLAIYEVDYPSTQAWKQQRLAELDWTVPPNTQLVPCDFERSTAAAALRATDFDPSEPAVVSWAGVIYYLERATADSALANLASLLAPGSEVVLDVLLPWEDLPERYGKLRVEMQSYLAGAGEPHVNRYRAAEFEASARKAGFGGVTIVDRAELTRRYLAPIGTKHTLSERFFFAVLER